MENIAGYSPSDLNKMRAQQFEAKDFVYDLPEDRIAKYPLADRDSSKLLVYKNGVISEDIYFNIEKYIPAKSLLIFNNTKVIQARLGFKNSTGSEIEIFCLEPTGKITEPSIAMSKKQCSEWICLVGNAKRWKNQTIERSINGIQLTAEIIEKLNGTFRIKFQWLPAELSFAEVIEIFGSMPIPPYLKRDSEEIDAERYQTIYARHEGSVAAPTAGLHFTDRILNSLKDKNIITAYLTLHVGAGTFIPIKSETIGGHEMHAEWIDVNSDLIKNILRCISDENKIIAVGTTSLRTIESLYWMGVKAFLNPKISLEELEIKQWDAYQINSEISPTDALNALLSWLSSNNFERLLCKTQIIIVPSYTLKIAQALITNFHQPSSTLILLVAAVVGDDWQTIYDYALENDFRFLSYGDGSLLFKKD